MSFWKKLFGDSRPQSPCASDAPSVTDEEILKELEKLSSSHGDDQRAIEQALLARGVPCLEALKHIALDHAVRLRMRKTAIFYATKFDHPSIAPFLAGFINGKNPAALHAACENGDERACEEVGLFSEAKSHAERLGFGVRQVQ